MDCGLLAEARLNEAEQTHSDKVQCAAGASDDGSSEEFVFFYNPWPKTLNNYIFIIALGTEMQVSG